MQFIQGLVVIHLSGGGKTVGTLAEIDLIEIQLKNFFLTELAFNLKS